MQVQNRTDVVFRRVNHLFVVCIDQKRQRRAGQAGGGLNHARPDVLLLLLVEERQTLAAALLMLPEIPAGVVGTFAAIGNTLELAPAFAEREAVLDVRSALGVVRQLVSRMLEATQILATNAQLDIPAFAFPDPVFERLLIRTRFDEILDFHLLEFERTKHEVAWCDLVAKRLSNLRDTKRKLASHGRGDVGEVDEDAL